VRVFASSITCDLAKVTLRDIYKAVGAPPFFAIGNRSEKSACLVEQSVNAALGSAFMDAEALLHQLGDVTRVDAGQRRNRFASGSHGFLTRDGQMAADIAWACRMEVAAMQKRGVLAIDDTPVLRIEDSATVVLADGRRIPHAGLFTYGRLHMASPIASLLGCEFDEGPLGPFIRTDMTKQTTVPGVFAGGDATRPAGNVAMAVADGAMAGLGAHRSLVFG